MAGDVIEFSVLFKPREEDKPQPERERAKKEEQKNTEETIVKKDRKSPAEKREDEVQFAEFWDRVKKEQKVENRARDRALEKKRRADMKRIAKRNQRLSSIGAAAPGALANPIGFAGGAAIGGLSKIIPGAFIALIAYEVFKLVRDQYFGPGGPGDTRLKILIENQVQVFMDRQSRADLQLGRRSIRTSTIGTVRGIDAASKVGGSQHAISRGEKIVLDQDDYASRGDP